MKLKQLLPVLALTLLAACAETEDNDTSMTVGNLTVSKDHPQPGDDIEITYSPEDPLEENTDIKAYYNVLVQDKSYAYDLDLESAENSAFTSTIKIPDSATAITLAFYLDESYDNNNAQGYNIPLYTADGEKLAGSEPSIAYFNMRYGSLYDVEMDSDSALAILKTGIEKDEATKKAFEDTYLHQAYRGDKEGMQASVDKYVATLEDKPEKAEKDYASLASWYALTGNKEASDSIAKVAETQFPVGEMARNSYFTKFRQAQGLEERKNIYSEYIEKIENPGPEKNRMLASLAQMAMSQGDEDAFMRYIGEMDAPSQKASMLNNMAWGMAEKGENLEMAEKMSKMSLDFLEEEKQNPSDQPDYYSSNMYKESLGYSEKMFYDTYAVILHKKGDLESAIAAQEKAVGEGKNPEYNGRYVQFLNEAGEYKKTQEKASSFIKENHGGGEVVAALKEAYTKNENTQDFESYLADLKAQGKQKAIAKLEKEMIDEEAPQFKLVNLDGEEVALNELGGKTVVLDFWATWCGPCIQSFPGMQKALDQYEDNPNVVFLFIDTWENESGDVRREKVSKFIAENDYSFEVLMDETKPDNADEYQVVEEYGVSGIPTKFIVGPDGRIKFKSVGYSGSADQLAEEVALMIEMASGKDLKV